MANSTELQHTADAEKQWENEGATVAPRVDILEKEDELLLFADLPGVKTDDIDLHFENGELTLHGRRRSFHEGKTRTSYEYEVTTYQRTFRIGENIATDKIAAELKDGVLTLHLPKVEAVRPRKIAIKGG